MTGTFASDVSSYQRVVDDSYPHPWLIFRACDGTYRDSNFAGNLAWAKRAAATGKLAGYTVYAVYEPQSDTFGTVKSMVGTPDSHVTVMIDVESWSGKIQGDHSAEITALYRALAGWLGDERRIIVYGNQGDLASLYPHRPPAERLIVASYGSTKPNVPSQIGWQYSDGQAAYPVPAGWPRSAAPFGPSDQNHFDLDPAALAAALGVGADMPLTDADKQWIDGNVGANIATVFTNTAAGLNHVHDQINGVNAGLLAAVAALQADVAALTAKVATITTGGAVAAPTKFSGTVSLTAAP